jgi:hypothetical protein
MAAGFLVIAALVGCNSAKGGSMASPAQPAEPMQPIVNLECKTEDYASFIGQPESVLAAATFPQGVPIRMIKPGQPVTMDFNAARVNFLLNDKGMIAEIRCG